MRDLGFNNLASLLAVQAAAQAHKVFTAGGVARAIDRMRKVYRPSNSLAGRRHEHKREIARRLRQAERDLRNQDERAAEIQFAAPGVRLSRRRRYL